MATLRESTSVSRSNSPDTGDVNLVLNKTKRGDDLNVHSAGVAISPVRHFLRVLGLDFQVLRCYKIAHHHGFGNVLFEATPKTGKLQRKRASKITTKRKFDSEMHGISLRGEQALWALGTGTVRGTHKDVRTQIGREGGNEETKGFT